MMTYGSLPTDLGFLDLRVSEMMYWMYCPIATPREGITLPPNLQQFRPILDAILAYDYDAFDCRYVYLTAKVIYVSGGNIGNRPGWHADGFGGNDINYIWSDTAPTEFLQDKFTLPDDCADAMAHMEARASAFGHILTYPDKHLLRLTPSVVHRPPVKFAPGMRAFAKVSISRDRYNLEGNSINHDLKERWPLIPRAVERNHPAKSPSPKSCGVGR